MREDFDEVLRVFNLGRVDLHEQQSPTRCQVIRAVGSVVDSAIKIYPADADIGELSTELAFVSHLYTSKLPVPRYRTTRDGSRFIKQQDGTLATVYDWIEGPVRPTLDGTEVFPRVVKLMATIHIASADFRTPRSDDWLWQDAKMCLERLGSVPQDLLKRLTKLFAKGQPWRPYDTHHLCHNDYGSSNIVWRSSDDTPWLIDFTNAIRAPREWDLAGLCADHLLRSATPLEPKAVLAQAAMTHDNETCARLDRALLATCFPIVLGQRAVFAAFNADDDAPPCTWNGLRRVLDVADTQNV
ncbi:phosphotransferase [Tateyamaria sp. syn59]|uniref:phosphotransferase n=1 Tax=Tateyamaria sp. syn59 TaxID=2576942 RepID=UPI0011BDFD5F|nr:phosphotransferase [Tateyamaria sp. syn59]